MINPGTLRKTIERYLTTSAYVLAVIGAAGTLSACVPLAAEDQQSRTNNMDFLMAETSRLSQKLTELEGHVNKSMTDQATNTELKKLKRDTRRIQKDVNEITKSRADTNADLEMIQADISTLRGRFEEGEFQAEKTRDTLETIEENVATLAAGLESLEADGDELEPLGESIDTINDNIDTMRNSIEETAEEMAAVAETLKSFEERLSSLEEMGPPVIDEPEPQPEPEPDPAAIYMEGYKNTMDKNYPAAMEIFKNFLVLFPAHELSDNARYWLGEIYYAGGDWERAILEFDKVIKKFPDGDKVSDALLKQGYSFAKLGDTKTAGILLKRLVEEFPETEAAGKARKRLEEMK